MATSPTPLGLKGVVVGQGGTYDEAMADVTSAIRFHIETFGPEVLDQESPVLAEDWHRSEMDVYDEH